MSVRRSLFKAARLLAAAALFVAVAVSVAPATVEGATSIPGTWKAAKPMSQARIFAPAVKLADGSVITAGGSDGVAFTDTAERWTPSTGLWTSAGTIGAPVAGAVAALLPSGKAIFAGGAGDEGYYGYADLYDPATNTWTQTPAMTHVHAYGAGAQLANGTLLVIAGMDGSAGLASASVDVYSPSGNTWSSGLVLPGVGRYGLTATAMADGRILVAGGNDGASALSAAAIYTSGSGWTSIESMKAARFDHSAVLLKDGRILVAGGADSTGAPTNSAEIYDPATGHWTLTGGMRAAHYGHTMTVLNSGWVLAAGGYQSGWSTTYSEIFDADTAKWVPTGAMISPRRYQSATLLNDGSVLVAGGHGSDLTPYLASSEVFTPPISYPATTYHPVAPTRLMDTRSGNGLSGKFTSRSPRILQIRGRSPIPDSAMAITGNLTITNQSSHGYVSVGPQPTNLPTVSTLNYPYGDNRANNVTVALDGDGRLALVLCPGNKFSDAGTADLILDVTGYFTADDTGSTYKTITPPVRMMDTRSGIGLSGEFSSDNMRSLKITGGSVPTGAVAVTGNLTAVQPTAMGWAVVAPSLPADPTELSRLQISTLNSAAGDIKANGVTVQLSGSGYLSFAWHGSSGSRAHLLFDVTGYFVSGTSGARFVPIDPLRVADTRLGSPVRGPIATGIAVVVPVAGQGHVSTRAIGMSGNLTVCGQTANGHLDAAPVAPSTEPLTSTLNFPYGDIRANGFDVGLAGNGSIGIVYYPKRAGVSTQFVIDVTGYFI